MQIVATYPYQDEHGALLYEVVRLHPKDFRCRRPDGAGGWTWKLGDCRRVLYRLPDLSMSPVLFHTEGEKDADRLVALGWNATTSPSGSNAWRDELADQAKAAGIEEVVVFPDSDASGATYADTVATSYAARGLKAKVVPVPTKDVSDFLAGHTLADLAELVERTPWRDDAVEPAPAAASTIPSATLGEILAVDPVSLMTTYVVTPWIPHGIGMLTAKPGVGKGKLAQDLCLARASGQAWLGLPVERGPALFWSGEQGRREDFRVTQALCRGRGITDAADLDYFEVIYDPRLRFGHPMMFADVLARLEKHPGLLIVIDSQRRAFEGDESDSAAADAFYRAVLLPLRAAGATVLTLAHPPKTTGQQRAVADENMVRGSGDWLAQLETFLVLRPVNRERQDPATERVTLRLVHAKARSGPQAPPLIVTLNVTHDMTPRVAFSLTATASASDTAADLAGTVKAVAALFEQGKRLSRQQVLDAATLGDCGRPARLAAIAKLVDLGVIDGPLDKVHRLQGEGRGHWYAFVRPLPAPAATVAAPETAEDEQEWLP
jgi:hypothetical protein